MQEFSRRCLEVYWVAGTQDVESDSKRLLSLLHEALVAGITCFQWRDKGKHSLNDATKIFQVSGECLKLCRQFNVPMIIDDDIKLALELGADGVHVGQQDMPIEEVLKLCPKHWIVGLSVNTFEQALVASKIEGIDYLGVGPIYATRSKADASEVVGTDLIYAIRKQGIHKPLVGIGGINSSNAIQVYKAGADGVAIISALTQATSLEKEVAGLRNPF